MMIIQRIINLKREWASLSKLNKQIMMEEYKAKMIRKWKTWIVRIKIIQTAFWMEILIILKKIKIPHYITQIVQKDRVFKAESTMALRLFLISMITLITSWFHINSTNHRVHNLISYTFLLSKLRNFHLLILGH